MKTFGNVELAKKMLERFGDGSPPIKVELLYTKEVTAFIQKVEQAHQNAANSTLHFG